MRTTLLCLASYEKGADFLREAKRQGARVLLITTEKLAEAGWPRESIDGFYYMPDLEAGDAVINAVSFLARTEHLDRIIALDEFDLETAAALREHLRVPGLGTTDVRAFRDKLVMREKASAAGITIPEFTPVFQHERVRDFLARVRPPWVLKPRTQASAVGIRKLSDADQVWRTLEELGDRASHFLLERYVPGDVFHVDSIVFGSQPVLEEVHRYETPPFDVMHAGGIFATRTVPRGSALETELRAADLQVVSGLGLTRGVLHTEFIAAHHDGRIHFLETAARVGGANIAELVEAATSVNLWREWARIEIADTENRHYEPPTARTDYGGVVISLARQEHPDTSAYNDPEIVGRLDKRHHAGLIFASPNAERIEQLLHDYLARFLTDFHASLPAPEKPTA